jgi:hypothetical protein
MFLIDIPIYMNYFDQFLLCFHADAVVKHVDWDGTSIRNKLQQHVEVHTESVRSAKLDELKATYEVFSYSPDSEILRPQHASPFLSEITASSWNPSVRNFYHNDSFLNCSIFMLCTSSLNIAEKTLGCTFWTCTINPRNWQPKLLGIY